MKLISRRPDFSMGAGIDFRNALSELLERFWKDDLSTTELAFAGWEPRVDISEKDGQMIIKADIPGVDEKKLDVQVVNNVLTISGEREEKVEKKEQNYHRIERSYGSFSRSIELPETVSTDKIQADYQKGVLTVRLPMEKPKDVKKISVKVS